MATVSVKSGAASAITKRFAAASGIDVTQEPQFSPYSMRPAYIRQCKINAVTFTVDMSDGRTLQASTTNLGPVADLHWRERRRFRVNKDRTTIEWPDIKYRVTLAELMRVD